MSSKSSEDNFFSRYYQENPDLLALKQLRERVQTGEFDGPDSTYKAVVKAREELYSDERKITRLTLIYFNKVDASIVNNFPNLEKLYIASSNLVGITDKLFQGLSNLKLIGFRNCKMLTIPEDIFQPTLSLERIEFHDLDLSYLPDNLFSNLTSLNSLILTDLRRLTSLPPRIFDDLVHLYELALNHLGIVDLNRGIFDSLTNLNKLVIRDIALKEIPKGIFRFNKELEKLDFSYTLDKKNGKDRCCKIESFPMDIFQGLRKLKLLYLQGIGLTTLPVDIFENLDHVESLHLENNQITEFNVGVFESLPSLKWLVIYNNPCNELPLQEIFANPKLIMFNVDETQLSSSNYAFIKFTNESRISIEREFETGGQGIFRF